MATRRLAAQKHTGLRVVVGQNEAEPRLIEFLARDEIGDEQDDMTNADGDGAVEDGRGLIDALRHAGCVDGCRVGDHLLASRYADAKAQASQVRGADGAIGAGLNRSTGTERRDRLGERYLIAASPNHLADGRSGLERGCQVRSGQ